MRTCRGGGGHGGTRSSFARRKIAVSIHTDGPLGYSIALDGKPVLLRSRLGLELAGDVKLGEKPVVRGEKRNSATIIGRISSARTAACAIVTMD